MLSAMFHNLRRRRGSGSNSAYICARSRVVYEGFKDAGTRVPVIDHSSLEANPEEVQNFLKLEGWRWQ